MFTTGKCLGVGSDPWHKFSMEPFKNLLSIQTAGVIATHLQRQMPALDKQAFLAPLIARLEGLEMKARAVAIAERLAQVLPDDPLERATILRAMLHPSTDAQGQSDDAGLQGWAVWPLNMVVARHGVADFEGSMRLLREMTMRFTSEFAVRPFLIADQSRALAILSGWIDDPNPNVRRWLSEGTRPRLPWGERLPALIADPNPVLPLLTALRDDPSDDVRRSVANHLNDISKDHPALVTALAEAWMRDAPPPRRSLIKHALRSLIKAGSPEALAVLGQRAPCIEALAPILAPRTVTLGGALGITCAIRSTSAEAQSLTIDIVLYFRKADGRLRPKVFKGVQVELAPYGTYVFSRLQPLRAVTTRRHYGGEQATALRINGQDTPCTRFTLRLA